MAGSLQLDAETYAEWGVDYLKVLPGDTLSLLQHWTSVIDSADVLSQSQCAVHPDRLSPLICGTQTCQAVLLSHASKRPHPFARPRDLPGDFPWGRPNQRKLYTS